MGISNSLLTPAEEQSLARRARAGDVGARNELVMRNKSLVGDLIKPYIRAGMEEDDLFQAGVIGLMYAADQYDPDRGARFATYAYNAIRRDLSAFAYRTKRNGIRYAPKPARKADFDFSRYPDDREEREPASEASARVATILRVMRPRERLVITRLFGLDGKGGALKKEVAAELGVTYQRVGFIEKAAFEWVRKHVA